MAFGTVNIFGQVMVPSTSRSIRRTRPSRGRCSRWTSRNTTSPTAAHPQAHAGPALPPRTRRARTCPGPRGSRPPGNCRLTPPKCRRSCKGISTLPIAAWIEKNVAAAGHNDPAQKVGNRTRSRAKRRATDNRCHTSDGNSPPCTASRPTTKPAHTATDSPHPGHARKGTSPPPNDVKNSPGDATNALDPSLPPDTTAQQCHATRRRIVGRHVARAQTVTKGYESA